MCNALLRLDADIVAEWFVAGKTREDTKTLLKLPERYTVEGIAMDDTGQHLCVTVDVPELPESAAQVALPELEATFGKAQDEDGQWHVSDSYRLAGLKAIVALPLESKEA
jgi:hypothetical protein